MKSNSCSFKVVDLFCGCGGLSLGFRWDLLFQNADPNPIFSGQPSPPPCPFTLAWANDYNQEALQTYRRNFDPANEHTVFGPIESVLENGHDIPHADVVIGGPPCQGFSLLNKNRTGDERRSLWWQFMEVAERSGAKVILMENVPELLGSPEFGRIKRRLKALGYRYLMAHVLHSSDYGVPQVRRRSVILASKCGPISLPVPTHFPEPHHVRNGKKRRAPEGAKGWPTVRDAINDLKNPIGTEIRKVKQETYRLHFGRTPTPKSLERYKAVPPGGNRFDLQKNRPDITPMCWIKKTSGGTDLFGRLWWDRPSVTIRTEFFKPEKGRYLHPVKHRPITHREAARIQSFPDSFVFEGSKVEIAKQIGNAVPPVLAYAIAQKVAECLRGLTTTEEMRTTQAFFSAHLGENLKEVWYGA